MNLNSPGTGWKTALAALGIFMVPMMILHFVQIPNAPLRIHLCYWVPLLLGVAGAGVLGLWRVGGSKESRWIAAVVAVVTLLCFVLPAPVAFLLKWVSFTYGNHLQLFNNLAVMTVVLLPLSVVACRFGWAPLAYEGIGRARSGWALAVLPGVLWFALFLHTPWQFQERAVVAAFVVYALALESACFLLYRAGARFLSALVRGTVIYTNVYILGDGSTDLYPATMYTASGERFYWMLAIAALTGAALSATFARRGKRSQEAAP